MKSILIDTDVFVRDLRYHHDRHAEANAQFLQKIRSGSLKGATSIFNLIEVCGILSFGYTTEDLNNLYSGFADRYKIQIFVPADSGGHLQYDIEGIFSQIRKKQDLGDAQISYVITKFADHISHLVSWNARHFEGKVPVPVKTPEDF